MRGLADIRVAVVGLGLMGGSLAGALRGRCRTVVGVARRPETIETARQRGLVEWGTTDLAKGVRSADVVVLATPVRVILRLLDEIAPFLPGGSLLMDLGSTKAQIVARMAALPDHVQPLGGHPMCGREVSGIAAADPALYQGHTFVLTPLVRTSGAGLALGHRRAPADPGPRSPRPAGGHDQPPALSARLFARRHGGDRGLCRSNDVGGRGQRLPRYVAPGRQRRDGDA
jgi:hypothetical protein